MESDSLSEAIDLSQSAVPGTPSPAMAPAPRFLPAGEQALCVEFDSTIDEAANRRVLALAASLDAHPQDGVREWVPTYRSLLVLYDPERLRGRDLEAALAQRCAVLADRGNFAARQWTIPVLYGGTVGQDLAALAEAKGMTVGALVALHADASYRVYMIGFAPGFAYLGGLPAPLQTPRLSRPRQNIPAGAIGIGGQQASVNSVAGPSGWRFIGWTPVRLFDPERADPFLLATGDRVRFRPVDEVEAAALDARAAAGDAIVRPEDLP